MKLRLVESLWPPPECGGARPSLREGSEFGGRAQLKEHRRGVVDTGENRQGEGLVKIVITAIGTGDNMKRFSA
jgi:hypothetical protein